MPIVLSGSGTLTVEQARVPDVEALAGGTLEFTSAQARDVTLDGTTGSFGSLHAADSEFRNISLTNLDTFGGTHLSKTRITEQLVAIGCDEINATGLRVTAGGGAEAAIDLTDCQIVKLEGIVRGAGQESIRLEDVVAFEVDMLVMSTPSADNTYDAISLEGVCDRGSIRGGVHGAADPAGGANNPRYGIAVASGCLDIHIWAAISGAQTGDIDDNTTGEVTVH
jgi:hypothetical protein